MAKNYMDWDGLVEYHRMLQEIIPTITVNEAENLAAAFFAPTSKGTAGQVLRWPSSGNVPAWDDESGYTGSSPISVNQTSGVISHSSAAGNKHVPAGGASGQFLKWSAAGTAVWGSAPVTKLTLNGSVSSAPSFYAPTTAGTSGYFLQSTGSGAPTWAALSGVMKYKGSVDTYAKLPTAGQATGDCWNVSDTGKNYAWNGTAWDDLGGTIDLSNYVTFSDKASTAAYGVVKAGSNIKVSNGVIDIQSIPLTGAGSIASLFN